MTKEDVKYRLAEERDVPKIKEMYSLLNHHFYRTGYRLPSPENVSDIWWDTFRRTLGRFSNSWVAEVGDIMVGFITCRVKRVPAYMGGVMVGELSDMWIIPEARRLGVGDTLSRTALEWLKTQDVHSVEIQVLLSNEASWTLFERMGFKQEYRLGRLVWDEYIEDAGKG